MAKVLKFELSGYVNADIDCVIFTDGIGEVTSSKVDTMTAEELTLKIREHELDFNWTDLINLPGFNLSIDDIRVEEEE